MPSALITGANGHIGCHVVRAVMDQGWTPIAFVRPGADRRGLEGLDIEVREGDLLDADSVNAAAIGVDVIHHVGAVHRNYADDPELIIKPAVDGTKNVLEAARRRGVRRVVYTSTGATVGFAKDANQPLDETAFMGAARSAYVRGKVEAERIVREAASAVDGPEVVIANPSGVFGPRDHKLTPATRGLMGIVQGDPIFFHLCATHVSDVGLAHALLAERGRPGERYLITGDNLAPSDVASVLEQLAGKRPATFKPPAFLLNVLLFLGERQAARSGTDAPATRDALADLGGGHLVYDSQKSRTDLGLVYRPAFDVFRDALRWLLFVEALKPRVAARVRTALGSRSEPDPDWV